MGSRECAQCSKRNGKWIRDTGMRYEVIRGMRYEVCMRYSVLYEGMDISKRVESSGMINT